MTAGNLTPAEVADALVRAADTPVLRAAVGLLAEHDYWLTRIALHHPERIRTDSDGVPFGLDWAGLGRDLDADDSMRASGSQLAILAIAVSLNKVRPVDLGVELARLDRTNSGAVVRAVAMAAGCGDLVAATTGG